MAGGMLPPVVAEITLNTEQFTAGVDEVRSQMTGLTGEMDGAMTAVQAGADEGAASMGKLAASGDEATASLDRTAESATAAGDAMTRTGEKATVASDSAALMGTGAVKGAEEMKTAEDDAESHTSGFSGRVASVFSKVGETMGHFGIPFHASVSKMGEDISQAENRGSGFSQSMVGMGNVVAAVGATAIVGFGAESIKMADEFDVAQTRLKVAIAGVGGSFQAVRPQIENTYTKMEQLGFNDQQTAETLQVLTTAAKSPTKAMQDMGLAADLARQKNMSLSAAGEMLAKVYAGSNRAVMQMGLNLDLGSAKLHSIQTATEAVKTAQEGLKKTQTEVAEGTLKGSKASFAMQAAQEKLSKAERTLQLDQHTTQIVMSALEKRTRGAAQAFGQTLAGQADAAKASIHNLGVQFGEILLPIIAKVLSAVLNVITFFRENHAAALALAVVIGGALVAALGAAAVAFIAANAATLGIGIAIAAVVAGIVLLIEHWKEVTAFIKQNAVLIAAALAPLTGGFSLLVLAGYELVTHWKAIWSVIGPVVNAAVSVVMGIVHLFIDGLKAEWEILKAVVEAVFGAIKAFLVADWNAIKSVSEAVWNAIKAALSSIWGTLRSLAESSFNAVRSSVQTVWNAALSITSSVWSAIESAVSSAVNALKSAVSSGLSAVLGFFQSLPGKILGAIAGLGGQLLAFGEHIIQMLIQGVENAAGGLASALSGVVSHAIGGIGGIGGKALHLLGLASGGIVTSPTLAVVGEAGPEAVIPLSQLGGAAALGRGVSPLPSLGGGGAGTGTGAGATFNTTIISQASTPEQLVNELYLRLRPHLQGNPA